MGEGLNIDMSGGEGDDDAEAGEEELRLRGDGWSLSRAVHGGVAKDEGRTESIAAFQSFRRGYAGPDGEVHRVLDLHRNISRHRKRTRAVKLSKGKEPTCVSLSG